MHLKPFPRPDLASWRGQLTLAAVAALIAGALLWVRAGSASSLALGDTDDATRLVLVRDLLAGRGWYDQLVTRLQPPMGVWMHWSRLLDGALAAFDLALRPFLGAAGAETAMRTVWPLLCLFPAASAVIAASAALCGRGERGAERRAAAGLAAAALVVVGIGQIGVQFHPGRVDHHDVQITFALIALGAAMGTGLRSAVVSGVATGLGLAIGLEALLFEAGVAAMMGLRLLLLPQEARRIAAYGVALAAATALAFAAQTPPLRWTVSACDALGWNLLLGAATGGLLLALTAMTTARRPWPWRLAALAGSGAVALAVYLRLDPNCLHGPFADVDPAIRPFWLDHVNEVKPIKAVWKSDRSDAVMILAAAAMAVGSWATLGLVKARRVDPAWWMMGVAIALGIAAAASAVRMRSYLEWFAVVPLAVAAAEGAVRLPRLRAIGAAALGALFSPTVLGGLILVAAGAIAYRPPRLLLGALVALAAASLLAWGWRVRRLGLRRALSFGAAVLPLVLVAGLLLNADRLRAHAKPAPPETPDTCFDAASYAPLAKAPAGVVLSEVDLGPFVLAHTPSSAMSAPYHRMSWGLLKDRAVLVASADGAAPGGAQARARALGAAYVLECPVHHRHADRDDLKPDSLQARLDRGLYPDWLAPMSDKRAGLQIYRLLPPRRR